MDADTTKITAEEAEEAGKKLQAFIVQQINSGADQNAITASLEKLEISHEDASNLVETMYPEIMKIAKEQAYGPESLLPALLGGGLAALIGAWIWGFIAGVADMEVGYVAWGLGGLVGYAVVLFTKGKKGPILQTIAVGFSFLGILLGKYFAFCRILKKVVAEESGEAVASGISAMSGEIWGVFVENLSSMLGLYDILWVGLAVWTAWGITKGLGIKPERLP